MPPSAPASKRSTRPSTPHSINRTAWSTGSAGVLPLVDRKYRLIAIDMKGYGRSDREAQL
jgi:pimeloyl-ACP methyl ester carboxylesterase